MNEYFKDTNSARENLNSYKQFFENLYNKKPNFSSAERAHINQKSGEYYQFLKNEGFCYGSLGFDMSQNTGKLLIKR